MSAAATAWALQQRAGKAKLLLVVLGDLADERGETRVEINTLAEAIEADRSTVIRHLEKLEEAELIERTNHKGQGGVQLISTTRLLMGATVKPLKPESQNATRQEKTPCSTPSQNATRPVKAESQNATHKGKDLYSLDTSLNTNNNTYREALRAVDAAGLLDLWRNWVALGRLARPTREAQIAAWAAWVGEGRADALRAEAQNIIDLGSYAHPFAGLKKRMALGTGNVNGQGSETGSGPARPALRPGQRVRYPDGSEALVVAVLSRGVATDHPDFPDVPLGQVKTLTVLE